MKYGKNPKLAKEFLKWFQRLRAVRALVRGRGGVLRRRHEAVGAAPALDDGR